MHPQLKDQQLTLPVPLPFGSSRVCSVLRNLLLLKFPALFYSLLVLFCTTKLLYFHSGASINGPKMQLQNVQGLMAANYRTKTTLPPHHMRRMTLSAMLDNCKRRWTQQISQVMTLILILMQVAQSRIEAQTERFEQLENYLY